MHRKWPEILLPAHVEKAYLQTDLQRSCTVAPAQVQQLLCLCFLLVCMLKAAADCSRRSVCIGAHRLHSASSEAGAHAVCKLLPSALAHTRHMMAQCCTTHVPWALLLLCSQVKAKAYRTLRRAALQKLDTIHMRLSRCANLGVTAFINKAPLC